MHPEAAVSMILAATSCYIDTTLHHIVLKLLHNLFLHSDEIKLQLLQCNTVEFLCNTLVILFEHKVAQIKKSGQRTIETGKERK